MKTISLIFGIVSLLVSSPANALQYNNHYEGKIAGEKQLLEYNNSLGVLVVASEDRDTQDEEISRCIVSFVDENWLLVASHCVYSSKYQVINGFVYPANNSNHRYKTDLVVLPKIRTELKNDGTDVANSPSDIVNDYALVRLVDNVPNTKKVTFCPNNLLPDTKNESFLAKTLFFGSNNFEYGEVEAIIKPLLAGEDISLITSDQVIKDIQYGIDDIFVNFWNQNFTGDHGFLTTKEANYEEGDSGGPVFLKDLSCQIGVISYSAQYNFSLTNQPELQIDANFASSIIADDKKWITETITKFENISQKDAALYSGISKRVIFAEESLPVIVY
jgi:secreted trypsin-like serine protease